jgi:hypothetical protein
VPWLPTLLNDLATWAVGAGMTYLVTRAWFFVKRQSASGRQAAAGFEPHRHLPIRSERIDAALAKRRIAAADIARIGQLAC